MSECVLLRTTTTLPVLNLIKCGIIYKLSTFIILHDLDVIGASDSFKVKKAIKYFYGKMWNEKEESSFNETRRYLFSCLLMVFDNIGHLQKVDLDVVFSVTNSTSLIFSKILQILVGLQPINCHEMFYPGVF